MSGNRILLHSLRMVFGNMRIALHISAVVYAVTVVAQYLYLHAIFGANGDITVNALGDRLLPVSVTIFFAVATFFGSIWIAVAWHRFVLLEEVPDGYLPKLHSRNMLEYLGVVFMIVLVLMIPVLALSLVAGVLLAPLIALNQAFAILFPLAFLPVVALFFRLSPMLPGAALGRSLKMADALNVTRPFAKAIWGLAAIELVLSMVLNLSVEFIFPSNMAFLIIENAILGWVVMMVNASLLTTIYGVAIEERELT